MENLNTFLYFNVNLSKSINKNCINSKIIMYNSKKHQQLHLEETFDF